MLKEMSVNLTENDLVIFCQQVLRFFTEFFLQCGHDIEVSRTQVTRLTNCIYYILRIHDLNPFMFGIILKVSV